MKFLATIEYIDFESLTKLMSKFFSNEQIVSKVKVIREGVTINSERIELYASNQHHESKFYFGGKGSYIIQQ